MPSSSARCLSAACSSSVRRRVIAITEGYQFDTTWRVGCGRLESGTVPRRPIYTGQTLRLSKKELSNSYKVTEGKTGSEVAMMKTDRATGVGSLEWRRTEVSFTPDDNRQGGFVMAEDGTVTATSTRLSGDGRRRFTIRHGETTLDFEIQGIGQKPFEATREDHKIGSVALERFAGRRVAVDLPGDLPDTIKLFAAWLALRDWNNAAQVRVHQ